MATKTKAVKAPAKCVICEKNKPHSRGACQSCLREMRTLIRLGRIKGKQMEAILLPPKKLGRKAKPSPVLAKLSGYRP
jgi:hypothetical protein